MSTWKPVHKKEYAQFNEVSDKGEIRRNGRILNQHLRNGYKAVCLYNPETKKTNTANVHRLVAFSFIENPQKYKQVNHINGDKTCNIVENLEWVSAKDNIHHAMKSKLHKPHPKRVKQYTKNGEYIKTYNSIIEASKLTGANDRHISCVCKGKRKTTGGFVWKYDIEEEVCDFSEGVKVKDFPNYAVTKDGRVYSFRSKKFIKPRTLSSGYKIIRLCNNGKMADIYLHKLVQRIYETPLEESSVLNHCEKSNGGSRENLEVKVKSEE